MSHTGAPSGTRDGWGSRLTKAKSPAFGHLLIAGRSGICSRFLGPHKYSLLTECGAQEGDPAIRGVEWEGRKGQLAYHLGAAATCRPIPLKPSRGQHLPDVSIEALQGVDKAKIINFSPAGQSAPSAKVIGQRGRIRRWWLSFSNSLLLSPSGSVSSMTL